MEYEENGLKTWQWFLTCVVVIVLIVIGILIFGKKDTETVIPQPSISMEDQCKKWGGMVYTHVTNERVSWSCNLEFKPVLVFGGTKCTPESCDVTKSMRFVPNKK